MKKLLSAVAFVAAIYALSSCQKDKEVMSELNNGKIVSLIATTEDNSTKTVLTLGTFNKKVLWQEGDSIKIGSEIFKLVEGAGTTSGKFAGKALKDGSYTAYYPASYDGTAWPSYHKHGYTADDKILFSGSPMTANVTVSGGEISNVGFNNVGGFIELALINPEGKTETIKRILVNSDCLASPITLDCGDGVPLQKGGSYFHIPMPAGTYDNMEIKAIRSDDMVCIKRLRGEKPLYIGRSLFTMASFTVSDFQHDYVEIAADYDINDSTPYTTLKWSTVNLSSWEGETYFYWWKSRTGWQEFGGNTLGPEEDAATYYWGGKWRTPTRNDFRALCGATSWTWADGGFYLTEKNIPLNADKSNALIFFPAVPIIGDHSYEGYGKGYGVYWAKDRQTYGNKSYALFFSERFGVDPLHEETAWSMCAIRPVSD